MNIAKKIGLLLAAVLMLLAPEALGQSSSLYTTSDQQVQSYAQSRYDLPTDHRRNSMPDVYSDVPRLTFYVNRRPAPREFAINDLVTIIVRESFESEMDSEVSTQTSADLSGGIRQFPNLRLSDLLDMQINGSSTSQALVDVGFEREHTGDGQYDRSESMTGRVRARIIDIRPNGTLILEARRTIINDGEQSVLVATGNCMPEDVSIGNTIESSQLENLFIDKQHSGELRDAGDKGWLTQIFDTIFDF